MDALVGLGPGRTVEGVGELDGRHLEVSIGWVSPVERYHQMPGSGVVLRPLSSADLIMEETRNFEQIEVSNKDGLERGGADERTERMGVFIAERPPLDRIDDRARRVV